MKKLYRSKTNRIVGGVFGGLGAFFGVDATVLRLLFAFFVIFTAVIPGVIAYIIAVFIIPEETQGTTEKTKVES